MTTPPTAIDRRRRNRNWIVADAAGLYPEINDGVIVALLMDLRDELQALNRVFNCENFLRLPSKVERIARNTAKPRRKRKVAR